MVLECVCVCLCGLMCMDLGGGLSCSFIID
jgi:hypothetical protein